jgi:hypothetical protein
MKKLVLVLGIVFGSGVMLAGCEDNPRKYRMSVADAGKHDAGNKGASTGGTSSSSGGTGGGSASGGSGGGGGSGGSGGSASDAGAAGAAMP